MYILLCTRILGVITKIYPIPNTASNLQWTSTEKYILQYLLTIYIIRAGVIHTLN